MQLYIGNKNYSSWSLRPWLLLRVLGIPFDEVRLRLDPREGSAFRTRLLALAPVARVPLLVDEGFAVWDSLAIIEYLAERHPAVWPAERRARARARSLCAEMHAGFGALRNAFPMNIEAALPEVGARLLAEDGEAARDLARIDTMWREQIESSGGPFLFGAFSAADAFYAPVCARIRTYALPLSAPSAAYLERVCALPAMRAWCDEARTEDDFIAEDEPYRSR
jgi:glutathione S-transferase